MKSIKRGRGPSRMSGFVGIFVALFGIFWTIMAAGMGGGFIAIFGILFVVIAVVNVVYNFKNATGENRYSEYDITETGEEPDPFNECFGKSSDYWYDYSSDNNTSGTQTNSSKFCPYCGTKVEADYEFCNNCGKKLP